MIVLTSAMSITALIGGAPATTNPDWTVAYGDRTATSFTLGTDVGALNGTTPVTLTSAPISVATRLVRWLTIRNRDSAAVTLTVRIVDGVNTRVFWSGTLAVGDTWQLGQNGLRITTSTGAIKS